MDYKSLGGKCVMSGSQSVERTLLLLKLVAGFGRQGVRLLDLTEISGLSRPTVHRILKVLVAQALVQQVPDSKLYRLGPGMFELGLAAPSPVETLEAMSPALKALAAETGDTAYLVMRRQDEAICLAVEEGAYPIRARTFEVGARRPLGLGAAGLALFAALPADEAERMARRNSERLAYLGLSLPDMLRKAAETRRRKYALSENTITDGVTGLAVVLPSGTGIPYLAVSVAAISTRMPRKRDAEIVSTLRGTAEALHRILLSGEA